MPSIREYAARYQIDSRRLGPRQLLMHPGPVNRGVELSPEVIDGPSSLIAEQVESGLVVRMAILYELLAGGRPRPGGARPPTPTSSRRRPRSRSPRERVEIDRVAWIGAAATGGRGRPRAAARLGARPSQPESTAPTTWSCAAARSPSSPTREAPSCRAARRRRADRGRGQGRLARPSSTLTFTCARPATRTRRTSRRAPAPRRPGGYCGILAMANTQPARGLRPRTFAPCASGPPTRPPSRPGSWPASPGAWRARS